jgi:tRNA/rRNA methyltransferase
MVSFATILVRPERPANVGAAARALKNFGLSDLRVVGQSEALPGGAGFPEARALAWNAGDVLEAARSVASLDDAVADLRLVAAASARPGPGIEIVTPREFAAEMARLPPGAAAGCVFGPEDHGLSNEELDSCRVRVRIPTASAQPSLNLAQSVMVVAYEVGLALAEVAPTCEPSGDELPAREGDVQRLADAFRVLALEAGYLNAQAPEHVLGELRRLLSRARPTQREVSLLLGLVAQLQWAQRAPHSPDEEKP